MEKIKNFISSHKVILSCVAILAVLVASVLVFGWIGLWYAIILAAIVGISLTGMKKHGLLKILTILMLLIMLLSNVLPGRQEIVDRIGVADLLVNYFSIVLQNFSYIVLFVLVIGGFYGVLNKTASYKKLLDTIVTKLKPNGKRVVFVIMILFAVIASLTGMTVPLFIFIPFVASIILLLGYDKLVAFSATFGSTMIGYIGGVFVSFINPNTYKITTFDEFVGLETKFTNVFPKLLLLFAGITLLIYFVSKHIKSVEEKKVKYELSDNSDLLIAEVKGEYKNIKTWPLITILSLIFVILVIGIIPWQGLFGIDVFNKFHTWLNGLSIKGLEVFPSIISANLPALGGWYDSGNFMAIYVYAGMLVLFATVLVMITNKIKVNEALDNFLDGSKKLIPAAFLISLAFCVLVCAYNNGFFELIITKSGKFNYALSSLYAFIGCILNVDTTWITAGIMSQITNLITDESIYSSVAVLFQGIYGIFMLVGPTSLFLILGLSYLDIPYTTWLRYIWRFILALIILLALVVLLVTIL